MFVNITELNSDIGVNKQYEFRLFRAKRIIRNVQAQRPRVIDVVEVVAIAVPPPPPPHSPGENLQPPSAATTWRH